MIGEIFAGLADTVIKRIWPDATEEERIKLEALKVTMASELAVHATNQAEAQHPSVFVAGWRPFIGWMCGMSIAYAFLVQPLLAWVSVTFGGIAPPELDTGVLTSLTFAMLGMSGMRMYEGLQGTKRSTWPQK